MKRIAVAVILLLSAATLAAARLPKSVVPSHYALSIAPDLANETFSGQETIDVDVKEPVDTIVLNAVEMELTEVSVTGGGKTFPATVTVNTADQTVALEIGGTL